MRRYPRLEPADAIHSAVSLIEDEAQAICFPERCPTDREDQIRMMRENLAEAQGAVPA